MNMSMNERKEEEDCSYSDDSKDSTANLGMTE